MAVTDERDAVKAESLQATVMLQAQAIAAQNCYRSG